MSPRTLWRKLNRASTVEFLQSMRDTLADPTSPTRIGEASRKRFNETVQRAHGRLREGVKAGRAAQEAAQKVLRAEQQVSTARLYFLTAVTILSMIIALYFLAVAALKFLARVELIWFFSRSAKLDDFRIWTQEICMEPWQRESVLCQAVEGNWLARELVRAKLQEHGANHCNPEDNPGGCMHTPCRTKGLSRTLTELRDAWSSPLNNRFNPIFYVLLPVRAKLKRLLRKLARGEMPLSKVERELHTFPLLERTSLPFVLSKSTNKRDQNVGWYLLNEFAYPALRDWGVIIGGSTPKEAKPGECAEPYEPFESLRDEKAEEPLGAGMAEVLLQRVQGGVAHAVGRAVGSAKGAASWMAQLIAEVGSDEYEEFVSQVK